MSGKILDLSMSGCLVVPDDHNALQEGDLVEVSFSIHGFSIRVGGCIRNKRPDHSMGIEFNEGRDSSNPQVAQLMQKLAEEWMQNSHQQTRR
jgi:PilZ domain